MSNILEPVDQRPRAELPPLIAPPAQQDRIDLRGLINTLRRRLGLFFIVLAGVILAGAIITARQKPVYSATSQVVIDTQQPQVAPTPSPLGTFSPTSSIVATQAVVLQSRALAARVATALDLDHNPEFMVPVKKKGGIGATIKGLFGPAPQASAPLTPEALHQQVIDRLQAGLDVARVADTYALQITYSGSDPVMVARIANEFARQYTGGQLRDKVNATQSTTTLLAERLEGLRQQAQRDTERVERYRAAHNLLSTTGATLTEQEIASYNEQVAAARAQAAEDKARLDTARAQLRAGSSGGDVGAALGSPVVTALRVRRAEVGSRLANLEARYGALHPEVIKARSELKEVDSQIAGEIGRIISNLQAQARVSEERLGSLSHSLSGAKGTLAENGQAAVGLDDLTRRATTSQGLYEAYLNRYKETGAQQGTERADAHIVSLADVPRMPTSPHPTLNMILATLIGVVAGLAAAFIAEMAFSGLTTARDVEQRLGEQALGIVPTIQSVQPKQSSAPAALVETPGGPFAESIRGLRRSIQYAAGRPVRTLAITSALPKEGKTTLSLCLARSAGLSGERVVLIDCDMRQRGLTRMVNAVGDKPGLVELLRGEATLEDVLIVDTDSGAFVLPQPRHHGDLADLVVGPEMDALLVELQRRFSQVLLDTAPALAVADTRVLATKVDAVVLAARWRKTSDHAVRAALRLLPPNLANVAGVALTQVDMRLQSRFGYGDPTFYYSTYKDYYA